MTADFTAKREAFLAWQKGGCSDAQLDLAIASITNAIETLRAIGNAGHWLMGLHMQLQSMEAAHASRKRNP